MKPKTLILMVVAVGCGLVAAFLVKQGMSKDNSPKEIYLVAKDTMPANTPLSVLAVEVFNLEFQVIREDAGGPAAQSKIAVASSGGSGSGTALAARTTVQDQVVGDPLGAELGSQRILRVSPLTTVSPAC